MPDVLLLSPGAWVASLLAVALGALVQGCCGFGLALTATPLLLLIDPRLVPGALLVTVWCLALAMVHEEWTAESKTATAWAVGGSLPGAFAGALAVRSLSEPALGVMLGGIVLGAVALSFSGWHVTPTRGRTWLAGMGSGFMGTVSSIGGPPLALLYQKESGSSLRGVMSGYFVFGSLVSLVALALADRLGTSELVLAAQLLPGIAVGFLLSRILAPRLNPAVTRTVVLFLSAAAGLILLLRELG